MLGEWTTKTTVGQLCSPTASSLIPQTLDGCVLCASFLSWAISTNACLLGLFYGYNDVIVGQLSQRCSHLVSTQQGVKWVPLRSYVPGTVMVSGIFTRVLQSCSLVAHNKLRGRAASVGNLGTLELRIGRLSQVHRARGHVRAAGEGVAPMLTISWVTALGSGQGGERPCSKSQFPAREWWGEGKLKVGGETTGGLNHGRGVCKSLVQPSSQCS